ncbi:MAG: phosphate regulon sensor histidine kinase PhoR [Burkholderiales bacterium]
MHVRAVLSKLLALAIPVALLSAIAGALGGLWAAAGCAVLLLTLALAFHVRNLLRLKRWLKAPTLATLPQSTGLWEDAYAGLARLLRDQRQSETNLSRAVERFRLAGAAMPEGLVILDGDDRILWCNPAAERHFGLELARDARQQITYLVRQPQFAHYLAAQSYGEPLILRTPRPQETVLSVQLVPYGDNQKLVTSRDITHWERVETMRRDFVANVSHELRTPLTVLVGFLETLNGMASIDHDIARRTLKLMGEQGGRMQRLVEDLLTLSQLESTQNPPREEPVDVARLARDLRDDAQALSVGRHRIQLAVECADWVMGSEAELRSAFGNLVSNAVRYTPDGGEIRMAWRRGVEGEGPTFSVQDSGIGIESHHLPRLTERFYRVDRGRSRDTGGTGLGLAIVKHVLNRHQARLEVKSEPGHGSTFTAIFPRQRVVAAPAASESLSA